MAITKNTTKCTRPKHNSRVGRKNIKATLVSKSNKPARITHKRGKEVDFNELSHRVTAGKYEGFKGKLLGKDSEGNVTFRLLINPRGKAVKEASEITVHEDLLEEVNSNDMLSLVPVGGEEEEDRALIAFENTTWECGKCNGLNNNDGSICNNLVGGKVCGAHKQHDGKILGWGGCFKVSG